jgi:cobalt-zinc-cadmium efflux system outer membrane protein
MHRHLIAFAAVLALAGCSLVSPQGDLALQRRPDLTIALPVIDPGETGAYQSVRYDEPPEKLPAPKEEPRKPDEKNEPADGKKADAAQRLEDHLRSSGVLTLSDAVQLCLAADPKLKAAAEVIVQAQADLVAAGTRPNPTMTVLPAFLPLFKPLTGNAGPTQFEMDLSFPIDWCLFGKMASDVARNRIGIDVSEFDYADVLRTRIEEVVVAYYDQLEAQALVKLARQDLETMRRTEQTLEKAVKAGGKAQVDLNRVRLDRLRSEQTLREAISARDQARTRLLALLGRKGPVIEFDVQGSLEGEPTAGEISSDALYEAAAASRPDVKSARAQLEKAKADVVAEDRKAYPEMVLRSQYFHQFLRGGTGQPDADTYGLGFDTTLPCYNRNQGARIKARSRVAQETQQLEQTLVGLRSEIDRLVYEYRLAAANARAVSAEQLKLAAEIREAITKAYQAGGRPLLDLLDAQRNYREVLRLQANTRANYYRAAYRLQNATGVKIQR